MTYRTIKVQAPKGWELEYSRKEAGYREWIDETTTTARWTVRCTNGCNRPL